MQAHRNQGVVPQGDLDPVADLRPDDRAQQAQVRPPRSPRLERAERAVGIFAIHRLVEDGRLPPPRPAAARRWRRPRRPGCRAGRRPARSSRRPRRRRGNRPGAGRRRRPPAGLAAGEQRDREQREKRVVFMGGARVRKDTRSARGQARSGGGRVLRPAAGTGGPPVRAAREAKAETDRRRAAARTPELDNGAGLDSMGGDESRFPSSAGRPGPWASCSWPPPGTRRAAAGVISTTWTVRTTSGRWTRPSPGTSSPSPG